jgi:hypothetical protein
VAVITGSVAGAAVVALKGKGTEPVLVTFTVSVPSKTLPSASPAPLLFLLLDARIASGHPPHTALFLS